MKDENSTAGKSTTGVDAVAAKGAEPVVSSKQHLADAASAVVSDFTTGKNDMGGRHSKTVHLPEGCFTISIEAHGATAPKDGE